jgi:hypothetical protein
MNYKKVVFNSKISGLCNRLRALCALLAIAELNHAKFKLKWTPNWACPEKFENLFESIPYEKIPWKFWGERLEFEPNGPAPVTLWKKYVNPKVCSEEKFYDIVMNYVRALKPLPHITKKINNFVDKNWAKKVIGIHIRKTDMLKDKVREDRAKNEPVPWLSETNERYHKIIKKELKINPSVKFFLATDNDKTEKELLEKFPDKIICQSKTYNSENKNKKLPKHYHRHTSIEDALIDVYLLSKCVKIYGTPYSSFNRFASWLNPKIGEDNLIPV